jgi:hypothetical protein
MNVHKNNSILFFKYSVIIFLISSICFNCDCYALELVSLQEPMKGLKKEVFSWMFGVKIAAVAVGSAFAIMKQSLVPFGVGAGITAGIQFFDKLIGDGAAVLI